MAKLSKYTWTSILSPKSVINCQRNILEEWRPQYGVLHHLHGGVEKTTKLCNVAEIRIRYHQNRMCRGYYYAACWMLGYTVQCP